MNDWNYYLSCIITSVRVRDVENSRWLIFVTQHVQALSKSLLKLCDKRTEQFYYLNSGCLSENPDKVSTSSNHRSVKTVIRINIV
jgi:hypothetical protein